MQLLSCRCLLGSSFYRITIEFQPFERKHIMFEASFTELSPCWKRYSWIICRPGNGFFDGWINAIYKYGWLKKLITVYSNSKNVAQSIAKNRCTKWTVLISALSYYLNAYFLENCESRFCIEKNCCSSYGDQNQINNNTRILSSDNISDSSLQIYPSEQLHAGLLPVKFGNRNFLKFFRFLQKNILLKIGVMWVFTP